MLQKDGFFRRREEGQFRQNQPINPAPATTAVPAAPAPSDPLTARAEPRPASDERREAKLVVGPQIKIKGVEISDCDTLVVEGRIEATLDSRVLEITQNGVFQGTGKVSGKIKYAKIKVEEGAELSGEISMLDKSSAAIGVTPRKVGNA